MKIKFGKFILNSDDRNWWITEEHETKSGKTDERMITGYCYTFEKALQTFIERRSGSTEATTFAELLEALENLFEDVKALDEAKFKADSEKLKEMTEYECASGV